MFKFSCNLFALLTVGNAWSGGPQGASNCLVLKNLTPQVGYHVLRAIFCRFHTT